MKGYKVVRVSLETCAKQEYALHLFHGNLVFVLHCTSYEPTACPASWTEAVHEHIHAPSLLQKEPFPMLQRAMR